MYRFWLNPALRYINDSEQSGPPLNVIRVDHESADNCLKETGTPCRDAKDEMCAAARTFADQTTLKPEEPMETPEITLYKQDAYLIYRERTAAQPSQQQYPSVNSVAISSDEIIRLESTANYCYVYTVDGERPLVAMSMKWVAHHMQNFVRIHRSHAVNPRFIADYLLDRQELGEVDRYLLLSTGEKLPWSRRHLKEARKENKERFRKKRNPTHKHQADESDNPDPAQ